MNKAKKILLIIFIVVIALIMAVTGMWFYIRCKLKIRPSSSVGTKEELITHFLDNQEAFEKAVENIEKSDYPAQIYGDWVSRMEDIRFNIYYEETESEDIINLFLNKEWYLDEIVITDDTETSDECIIFWQCNAIRYDYWGIYYTPYDTYVGWDGLKRYKPTETKDDGYYFEGYGCRYYTEKICDNWWYFDTYY